MKKVNVLIYAVLIMLLSVQNAHATVWDDIVEGLVSLLKAGFGWVAQIFNFIISGFIYTVLVGLFEIIVQLVNAIDFGTVITSTFAQWGVLPEQLVFLINAAGIPQGLAMITYAFTIRLALNLIPSIFTRV